MSKIKGRAKRWAKKIRNARWKILKKDMLRRGWVEVDDNSLVPGRHSNTYPPFIPTHLRGKAS